MTAVSPPFALPLPSLDSRVAGKESPIARHRTKGRHRAQTRSSRVGDIVTLDFGSRTTEVTQPGRALHRKTATPAGALVMNKGLASVKAAAKSAVDGLKGKAAGAKSSIASKRAARKNPSFPTSRPETPEDDHIRESVARQREDANIFETRTPTPDSTRTPAAPEASAPEPTPWGIGQGDLGGNNVPMGDRAKPNAAQKRSGRKRFTAGVAVIASAGVGIFLATLIPNSPAPSSGRDGTSNSDADTPTPSPSPSPEAEPAPTSPVPAPATPGQDQPGATADVAPDAPLVVALFNENPGVATVADAQELVRLYNDDPAAFVSAIRVQGTIVAGEENTPVTRNLLRSAGSRCAVEAARAGDLQQGADCMYSVTWADITGNRANLDFLRSVETSFSNGQTPDAASLTQLEAYSLSLA